MSLESEGFNLRIVSTYTEVIENMQRFNNEIANNIIPDDKVKSFYVWYYDAARDLFGPSKYIKYANMNYKMYKYFDRNGQYDFTANREFHGKTSDIAKYKWFREADYEISILLKEKLYRFLEQNKYIVQLKSNTRFLTTTDIAT